MDKNYFGITDTGKVRDNNEDTFIAEKIAGSDFIIACVIDGVGGYSGGEIASDIARQSILGRLGSPAGDVLSLMKDAIVAADEKILIEKQKVKEHENMACVLTLAVIDPDKNQLYYAHVGDTRLYLLRDKSLIKISKDQSFVGFMEDTGRLTEEQAMRHPKRNEINKAIGFGIKLATQEDYIETGQSPFLPGDLILLCSDGLSDMVNKQEITNILIGENSLQEKGAMLIAAANRNGGLDNITVVLAKNDNQSFVHEATKPVFKESGIPPVSRKASQKGPKNPNQQAWQDMETRSAPALQKSNKGTITILAIFCLIFFGLSAYLLWQNYSSNIIQQQKLTETETPRNAQEIKLQDTLDNLQGNTLILTDSIFKSPIVLTESIQFNKDTLFIIAKDHFVIKSDSAFRGNAVIIRPLSKYVFLENITFEDFNTAISSQNNELVLKKVQFINAPNAVQTIYNLPQQSDVNGKIYRSTFNTDSISATPVND